MNFPKLKTYFDTCKEEWPQLADDDYNFAPMAIVRFICDWQATDKSLLPAYLYLAKVYKNYPSIAEAMNNGDLSHDAADVNRQVKWQLTCINIDNMGKAA